MKKINTTKIMSLLAVLCMITSAFVGSTLAKYTTSGEGTASTKVAKWSFEVNDAALSNSFTFDLFKTIKDSDGTTDETDLSATDGSIIAPGTRGEFEIKLENLSEVPAQYAIDYTVANANNIPVKFSVDGTNWTDNLTDVAASTATQLAHTNGAETIKVQWQWAFAGDDTTDTNLGTDATATLSVTAKVTATQVD